MWAAAAAAVAFIAMDATIKGLSARYGAPQLTLFRFASGAVYAIVIWMVWRTPMPAAGHRRAHVVRSVLLMVTLMLYFQALASIPLAQAVAMGYTAPIFISLLAVLWLREQPNRRIWVALALGALGATLAMWPELRAGGGTQLSGLVCAGLSAISFAFVMVLTRKQAQHDALPTFLLLQNLIPMALLAVPAALTWQAVSPADLPAIAAVGAFATLGLGAITWALRHMEASRLAPMEYTGLLWAALLGYVAFGEVPSVYGLASAALIVAACLVLVRR